MSLNPTIKLALTEIAMCADGFISFVIVRIQRAREINAKADSIGSCTNTPKV